MEVLQLDGKITPQFTEQVGEIQFLITRQADEDTAMTEPFTIIIPASGTGSAVDPYYVYTAEQLNNLRDYQTEHFILGDHIDLSGYATGAGWAPISKTTGSINGNGYEIRNLYINRPNENNVGLFSLIYYEMIVENMKLVNVNVTGRQYTGGLSGQSIHDSRVENCSVTGSVTGTNSVGGLIGYAPYASISRSHANVEVTGEVYVGGLIGQTISSYTSDSYAEGNVHGRQSVGGLIGYNNSSPIIRSYATGDVTATNHLYTYVGGLAGVHQNANLESSYATGNVTGSYAVGGLVGYAVSGHISDSYALNEVITRTPGTNYYMFGRIAGTLYTATFSNNYAYQQMILPSGITPFIDPNGIQGGNQADRTTPYTYSY